MELRPKSVLNAIKIFVCIDGSELQALKNPSKSVGTELATEQELLVALLVILISGGALKLRETARLNASPECVLGSGGR